MTSSKIPFSDTRGFSFIYVIFVMLLLGGLGAAVYTITTSSSYTALSESSRNRAYQLALAGLNYTGQRLKAGTALSALNGQTFTLGSNRGQFTLTVAASGINSLVTSVGTVNSTDGNLLARVQLTKLYPPLAPPANQEVLKTTFTNLQAFEPNSLKDAANHRMIRIGEYVATGGLHMYWAAFTDLGTYPRPDADNPGCNMGFHTGRLHENIVQVLRQSWRDYGHIDYDVQVKNGWYKDLRAAVSGLNFRWHEVPLNSGLYEGYGLAFMRYTYDLAGCAAGYDYIPNSIKPPGMADKLLLVLWEQRVEGGAEHRRWLAYADLGTPAIWPNPRSGNDLKVIGAQDNVDGLLNDDSILIARVKEKSVQGQRINEISVFYGDASPYYNASAQRTPGSVCTDLNRKRMAPEWVDSNLFPTWPSNKLGLFAYTDLGIPYNIINFWIPDPSRTSDPSYYDFFTLPSCSSKIGPEPPSTIPSLNPVPWIINPAFADPNPDPYVNPADLNLVKLLSDKATLRTYKFVLNDFEAQSPEVGLHGMGNLNDSNRVVAFDDWAVQILGLSEL